MLIVGKTDSFEQDYMARFEKLATSHGVFVKYERDRAARDIGLHLTKALKSGAKQVTNSLVWFQMKGVMAKTLTKKTFEAEGSVSLTMEVEHLRHWFLDSEPTHLVVYVESVDVFLVMNLQNYVTKTWGHGILTLDQKTATVKVPTSSTLDDQAFAILLRYAEMAQWVKALNAKQADVELVHRGFNAIYAVGTAADRDTQCGVLWTKWLSKMRHELRIAERPAGFEGDADSGWKVIFEHWQYGGIDPESSYPYLELFALANFEPETSTNWWDKEEFDDDGEIYTLKNGDQVFGPNASNEFCYFVFGARLNKYGRKLFRYIEMLVKMGLLELREPGSDEREFISIAPWHSREI